MCNLNYLSKLLFLSIFVLLISCSSDSIVKNATKTDKQIYIRIPKNLINIFLKENINFNLDSKIDNKYLFGYLDKNQLNKLDSDLLKSIDILDQRHIHFAFDPQTLQLENVDSDFLQNPYQGYHNYEQLTETLMDYANKYSNLVFLDSIGQTPQKRELWVLKISDNPHNDENEPKFFYIANMHGDEPVGKELLLYLIDKLLNDYNIDPKITHLINNAQIYIMPSLNPDGFELRTRANAYGYDLNRNFPDFITDPNDSPLGRQLETQAMMKFYSQNFFNTALNFHGGTVLFNMPWDSTFNTLESKRFGDWKLMYQLARTYTKNNPVMYNINNNFIDHGITFGAEWMIIHGGLQDWAAYYKNSTHATVELTNIKWPHYSYLQKHWNDNQSSLIEFLYQGLLGLHILVTDKEENVISQIHIKISTSNLEIISNSPYINRTTVDTHEQNAIISVPGYKDYNMIFNPWIFDGTFKKIILEKL